jgi:hypothetical protein
MEFRKVGIEKNTDGTRALRFQIFAQTQDEIGGVEAALLQIPKDYALYAERVPDAGGKFIVEVGVRKVEVKADGSKVQVAATPDDGLEALSEKDLWTRAAELGVKYKDRGQPRPKADVIGEMRAKLANAKNN